MSGTPCGRRPPNSIAEMGTPSGFSHCGSMMGHCSAGAQKRELGCAAGSALSFVQSLPFHDEVLALVDHVVVHALPVHFAVARVRHVREDRVVLDGLHCHRVRVVGGAGADAEEAFKFIQIFMFILNLTMEYEGPP